MDVLEMKGHLTASMIDQLRRGPAVTLAAAEGIRLVAQRPEVDHAPRLDE